MSPHLLQAEQLEVIDHKAAVKHNRPAKEIQAPTECRGPWCYRRARRLPASAATANTAAARSGWPRRHTCCARSAAARYRVHQSLNHGRAMTLCCTANNSNSSRFTDDRRDERRRCTIVDPFGHNSQVADETDAVQNRGKEQQIGDEAVSQVQNACHGRYLRASSVPAWQRQGRQGDRAGDVDIVCRPAPAYVSARCARRAARPARAISQP